MAGTKDTADSSDTKTGAEFCVSILQGRKGNTGADLMGMAVVRGKVDQEQRYYLHRPR